MAQAPANFAACGASETVSRTFDFSAGLASGETITPGSAICAITVATTIGGAIDTNPAGRLIAGPTISGALVSILIGAMVDGVIYQLLISVGTTASQALDLWALQPCAGP